MITSVRRFLLLLLPVMALATAGSVSAACCIGTGPTCLDPGRYPVACRSDYHCQTVDECPSPFGGCYSHVGSGECNSGYTRCDQIPRVSPNIYVCCPSNNYQARCEKVAAIIGNVYCDSPATQVRTALGCIPINTAPLISAFLTWAVRLAGMVGFLVIVVSAFIIVTSAGDPKRLQSGKELFFSAVSGLFLIALSVVILNFLGVDILGLGSLGFSV